MTPSSGWSAMMTPAAWTPALRQRPSSRLPMSMICRTWPSDLYRSASSGTWASALSSVMPGTPGMSFVSRSVTGRGTPITRPTSLQTALAASVPKVMICATWPYLPRTYSITFCRPSWQMSMSISGISLRLGSMNRSNSSPYFSGSTLHSPSRYPTIVPTPEPRAPTGMPCSRA